MIGDKGMDIRKIKFTKGFLLWLALGFVLFILFKGGFTLLTDRCTADVDIAALNAEAEQLNFDGSTIITAGNDSKLFFDGSRYFNYINIDASGLSEPVVGARLYFSDGENGFSDDRSTPFYLREGFNEIKIKSGNKLRLDISDREGISLTLNSINLRCAPKSLFPYMAGAVLYVLVWLMLYFAAVRFGIKYSSIQCSAVMLSEGLFAACMLMVMLFGLGIARQKIILFVLIPLSVYALAMLYAGFKLPQKHIKPVVISVLTVMTIVMCIVGCKMASLIQTDLAAVYYSAWEIAEKGGVNTLCTGNEPYNWFVVASNNDYFVRYQNNLPILAILALLYKALAAFSLTAEDMLSNYISILLNVAFIMAGVVFAVLTAKNLFGRRGMLISLVMSALFIPYYINACRFYTDTLSMPFVTLALWLYSADDKRFKCPYIKYLLVGASIAVGALIKGSVMVMAAAVLIHCILKGLKNARFAVTALAAVIAVSCVWSAYTKHCSWIDLDDSNELEFPLVHWVMMGINRDSGGGYSQEDFVYTDSFPSKEEKKSADIELLKQRIAGFGTLTELGEYEFSKAAGSWLDGQFMQDNHIEWGINKDSVIYDVLTPGRVYSNIYKLYIQLFVYCMYIFAAIGALLSLKKPKPDYAMFLRLIMLGAMLFFMLWESKSRYLLNFTPVFMLAAIYGIQAVRERFFENGDKLT